VATPGPDARVSFVVPRYGVDVVGGAETLCRLLAERLAGAGADVEVLTTCAIDHFTWADHHPPGTTKERGVRVHRFRVNPRRDADRFLRHHTAIALGRPVPYSDQLEWMADSVWSEDLQSALATRRDRWLVGIPYLFGTAFWTAAAHPSRTVLIPCLHDEPHAHLPVVRDALTGVAGCMANAEGERELITQISPGAVTRVVGVGYDPEPVPGVEQVAAFCRSHGTAPGYLLYAGRREEGKGVPMLFERYARFRAERPDTPPLALMGSGDTPVPRSIAAHVVDFGFVPGEDRAVAYAGAAVLLHPSRLESFGMVLLEAWIAGTPALVNGASQVLVSHCRDSGGGLWFDDGDTFDAALDLMLGDVALRDRMARAGADYALSEFAWDEVLRRFGDALEAWS
jgi:glycosyltransferase involved in cell wall biosynthesis